jgi:hypothetical protein
MSGVLACARSAASPSPLDHLGARRRDLLLAPVARAVHPSPATQTVSTDQLGLREHVARRSLAESGATGSSRLLAPRPHGAPGSQVPAVAQSTLTLCSRRCAVQSLHLGKRRRQLTAASAAILLKAAARSLVAPSHTVDPGPVGPTGLGPAHPATTPRALSRAPFARLGRRSPRRSFPPGPPNLGTPFPLASLAEKESPGGKDALARRRSEWPKTATAGSPRGERRATTAPRSRPFPHQPLPPPRGPAACRSTGPAGVVQASRPGRRRALGSLLAAELRS